MASEDLSKDVELLKDFVHFQSEQIRLNKAIKKDQGDYNFSLSETISYQKQSLKEYEKTLAKAQQLNLSSIETKKIEKEIYDFSIRKQIAQNRLAGVEKSMNAEKKQQVEDIIKEQEQINNILSLTAEEQQKIADQTKISREELIKGVEETQNRLIDQKEILDVTQQEYLAHKDIIKGYETSLKIQNELLIKEKQAADLMGVMGKGVEILSKKLGVGDEVYSRMVAKSKLLNEQISNTYNTSSNMSFVEKMQVGTSKAFATLGAKFKVLGAGLLETGIQFGKALVSPAGIIAGIAIGIKKVWDLVVKVNEENIKFGRITNMNQQEVERTRAYFQGISASSNSILVNSRELMAVQEGLTESTGLTNIFRKDILETQIKTSKFLGLQADTQAELAKISYIANIDQQKLVEGIIGQVKATKAATGVGFQYKQIIAEAAKLGGVLGLTFAKYPSELSKSLTIVKALGQDMKQLDSQASGLTEWESSITAEMEAQLLTGKNINLTRARQLALDNDLSGLAIELNSQLGSSNEFLKMNRIQQESFAKSIGLSRDTLADVLKQREVMVKLGLGENATAADQLSKIKELKMTQSEINDLLGERGLQELSITTISETLTAAWAKVSAGLADWLSGTGVVTQLNNLVNWIAKPENIQKIVDAVMYVGDLIMKGAIMMTKAALHIADFLTGPGQPDWIKEGFKGVEEVEGKVKEFKNFRENLSTPAPIETKSLDEVNRKEQFRQEQQKNAENIKRYNEEANKKIVQTNGSVPVTVNMELNGLNLGRATFEIHRTDLVTENKTSDV